MSCIYKILLMSSFLVVTTRYTIIRYCEISDRKTFLIHFSLSLNIYHTGFFQHSTRNHNSELCCIQDISRLHFLKYMALNARARKPILASYLETTCQIKWNLFKFVNQFIVDNNKSTYSRIVFKSMVRYLFIYF